MKPKIYRFFSRLFFVLGMLLLVGSVASFGSIKDHGWHSVASLAISGVLVMVFGRAIESLSP
jgi:hypothetical protein